MLYMQHIKLHAMFSPYFYKYYTTSGVCTFYFKSLVAVSVPYRKQKLLLYMVVAKDSCIYMQMTLEDMVMDSMYVVIEIQK